MLGNRILNVLKNQRLRKNWICIHGWWSEAGYYFFLLLYAVSNVNSLLIIKDVFLNTESIYKLFLSVYFCIVINW